MDIPQDVQDLLLNFEQAREADGWDVAPSLWVQLADGRIEPLVQAIPDGHSPTEVVHRLARQQTMDNSKARAILVSMEGWIHPEHVVRMLDEMDPAEALQIYRNLPDPSTFAERQEVRTVLMIDYAGHSYLVGRIRGHEAMLEGHVDGPGQTKLVEGLKFLLGVHPRQSIARVVQTCIDEITTLIEAHKGGPPSAEDERVIEELIERMLTAYKIHLPEEYDRQVKMLKVLTKGRYPRNP